MQQLTHYHKEHPLSKNKSKPSHTGWFEKEKVNLKTSLFNFCVFVLQVMWRCGLWNLPSSPHQICERMEAQHTWTQTSGTAMIISLSCFIWMEQYYIRQLMSSLLVCNQSLCTSGRIKSTTSCHDIPAISWCMWGKERKLLVGAGFPFRLFT